MASFVEQAVLLVKDGSAIAGDVWFASESGQIADVSVGPSCADRVAKVAVEKLWD